MDDTDPKIAEKMREMMQKKSPQERMRMGFSMNETSRYLVSRAIAENVPVYSGADFRRELFLRFYGEDFDPAARQRFIDHLEEKSFCLAEEPDSDGVPEVEKKEKWWSLLEQRDPLRWLLSRDWKNAKSKIESVLNNVRGGENIFTSAYADDEVLSVLTAVPYLRTKGFEDFSFFKEQLTAGFQGKSIQIQVIYVGGIGTKGSLSTSTPPQTVFKIRPDKIMDLFQSTYLKKEREIRGKVNLIFMLSDLEETYAPWLEHAQIEGLHPLQHLVSKWEIPTVIYGRGSIYEPSIMKE